MSKSQVCPGIDQRRFLILDSQKDLTESKACDDKEVNISVHGSTIRKTLNNCGVHAKRKPLLSKKKLKGMFISQTTTGRKF